MITIMERKNSKEQKEAKKARTESMLYAVLFALCPGSDMTSSRKKSPRLMEAVSPVQKANKK